MFCAQHGSELTPNGKGRTSNNTTSPESDHEVPEICAEVCWSLKLFSRQSKILTPKLLQPEVNAKMIEKAISWLQINSWTRGLDFETTILACSYFYAYYSNEFIPKQRLQIICTIFLIFSGSLLIYRVQTNPETLVVSFGYPWNARWFIH